MPGIFDDERHKAGSIWPNPKGTRSIFSLDVVAKILKCPHLEMIATLSQPQAKLVFGGECSPLGLRCAACPMPRIALCNTPCQGASIHHQRG